MRKISSFDVLRRMCEVSGNKIQMAPLGNLVKANFTKGATHITIGVPGNVTTGILFGNYVGGLILADKDEFARVKAEMEAENAAD